MHGQQNMRLIYLVAQLLTKFPSFLQNPKLFLHSQFPVSAAHTKIN